jgi:hypothetical protein
MITPLTDSQTMPNGKENHPGSAVMTVSTALPAQSKGVKQTLAAPKGIPQPNEKKKRFEGKKTREQSIEPVGTNQAFDKLLVRSTRFPSKYLREFIKIGRPSNTPNFKT